MARRRVNGDVEEAHTQGRCTQNDYKKDCEICGFEWMERQMKRHYHTGQLVCPRCADKDPRRVDKA